MIKIMLSGEIGWDVYPEDIRNQLKEAGGKDIEVHMVSPGGSVMDGIEIFNMFRDYKRDNPNSQNILIIKGMAASMATYLAMNPAFDLVAAEDNAVFMIHNASGCTCGDYREMKLFAEILDGLTNIIGKEYAKKTGKNLKEIREMMDAETWLFGDEILKAGFIDEMIPSDNPKKKKSKSEALAMAKLKYSKLSDKMKTSDNNIDVHKIAAMIKPENSGTANMPSVINDGSSAVEKFNHSYNPQPGPTAPTQAQTPAHQTRDNNITEAKTMTLAELMAQNPAAKIEYDALLTEKFNAGVSSERERMQANMTYAATFLDTKSEYPDKIKAVAVKLVNGGISRESLEVAVTMFDAEKETQASSAAAAESAALGDTPGVQIPATTQTGEIKNELDFKAELDAHKKLRGMEVN